MNFVTRYFLVLICFCFMVAPSCGQSSNINPNINPSHIQELRKKLDTLLLKYTERHPDVMALKEIIREAEKQNQVKEQVSQETTAIDGADHVQIRRLKQEINELLQEFTKHHPDVIVLRSKLAELEEQLGQQETTLTLSMAKEDQPRQQFKETSIPRQRNRKSTDDDPKTEFWKDNVLRIPLTVKETAGVGATQHPVTTVVPLPFGKYHNMDTFRLVNPSGKSIPAQFEVMNRWWYRDNSIRHAMVHFQPTVDTFTRKGGGTATYYLQDDASDVSPETPLTIKETVDRIEVVTGPLKLSINKKSFNILDEVWFDKNKNGIFEDSEKIIGSNPRNGGVFIGRLPDDVQFDSSRSDITFNIEEAGPMRVVIRAEAVTKYFNPEHHMPGFAVRIYAYANKPFVKIDYQLQNSAKNKVFSWPLYFKEMNLDFRINLNTNTTVRVGLGDGSIYERSRENGIYLAQEFHDKFNIYEMQNQKVIASGATPDGFIDISDSEKGVAAFIRHFWQMWPNGLEVDADNKLQLQLFPRWSAQWRSRETPRFTDTDLYWLQDMQHVYKETALFFHGSDITSNELINLAKTFQYPPVATLPTGWYKETRATLDMGGLVPFDKKISGNDQRIHAYHNRDFNTENGGNYRFGWNQFYVDVNRKWAASQGGGWPYSVSAFIATENPSDYYFAEQFAIGELNVRPQWMAQYTFDEDWERLQLTENPYAGTSWRKINGGNFLRHYDAPFLEGTNIDTKPRDDQHGWFYHMEEAYYFTGNLWIKDWYQFIGEFRKTFLNHLDPYPDPTARGKAHALAHALQAYRVTGDVSIIEGARSYIQKQLRETLSPIHGAEKKRVSNASWIGYLSRPIIDFMEEVRGEDWQAYAEAFNLLSGMMEWNYIYGQFGNTADASKGEIGSSSYTAQNLADPQAWYYWHTGKKKYLDHLNKYIDDGINGGRRSKPRSRIENWNGDFQGRWTQFVRETKKADLIPPEKISDLKAARNKTGIQLTWTAPRDAVRHHIIWSDKQISETMTNDSNFINWWAANVVVPDSRSGTGVSQNIIIVPEASGPFYAVIFSFNEHDNMSEMSNLVSIR